MLPKPDKNKKTFLQDEYIEKNDPEIEKKILKKKRKLILFSLIITVGLSFVFWAYRSTKNFLDQDKEFSFKINMSVPKFNFNNDSKKNKSYDFNRQIEKTIFPAFENLSIYITDNNQQQSFLWQQNQDKIFQNQDLASIKNKVNSIKGISQSILNLDLPEGLIFQEIISHQDNYQYFSQITIPNRKILILIVSDQKQDISQLIESLYWNYIQGLN